jgi:hypoxanthine phosphoribosyltransferase
VQRIASSINADYAGREITMLVILKGAMVFAADLMRLLKPPVALETLRASSYREAMRSGGTVDVEDVFPDVYGRHVLIVEDIIDSGNTIRELVKRLGSRAPASIAVAALLSKPEEHGRDMQIDYLGREIGPEFVVGYGLDYAGYGRQFGGIWIVMDDVDSPTDT